MVEVYPKVSIIVLNYNGIKFLEDCFTSLRKVVYPNYEVIMVDNASHDESVAYVTKNFPEVKILRNQENIGFAAGNNRGARIAKGKYLFFLNNDTKVKPDFLNFLVDAAQEDSTIGICACKILTFEGKEEAAINYTCDGQDVGCTGRSSDIYGWQGWEGPVFFAEGSALFIRRDIFDQLGGFDERHFIFLEDLDLAWRAQLLGFKVKAVPQAQIYHFAGGTVTGGRGRKEVFISNIRRRYLGEKNQMRNMLKNYSAGTLLNILPRYLILNICEMTYFLIRGRFNVLWHAYIKAHIWNIRHFKNTLKERRKVQSMRKVSDSVLQSNMLKNSAKLDIFRRIGAPQFK
ncbi:MAG: glycosyltransferase family 2 protein [Candidatus Omnitrophica bacterium]|nr:glycosyltransferase family 2 protein [Candidatus Omnitrophota bacterium]